MGDAEPDGQGADLQSVDGRIHDCAAEVPTGFLRRHLELLVLVGFWWGDGGISDW